MNFIGIDPGLNGAIARIDYTWTIRNEDPTVSVVPMPTKEVDGKRKYVMYEIIRELSYGGMGFVVLEKQQAMPGQGTVSMFRTGEGFGILQGILSAKSYEDESQQLDYVIVPPQKWQKDVCPGAAGESKRRAIKMATTLFPSVSLLATPRSKKPHDGMADALCMAEYARRIYKFHKATSGHGE